MQIVLLNFNHNTTSHSYIVDSETAESIKAILAADPDIQEVSTSPTNKSQHTIYSSWSPSAKYEDWLRIIESQYLVKLVPHSEKDRKQPEETSLMRAVSKVGSVKLLAHGSTKQISKTSHKILS